MKSYKKFLKKNTYCIFLLHGIIPDNFTSEVRNYNRKHIFLSEYINFIDEMLELGNPLSIHDIVSHHVEKTPIPEYSFCISFDDGFYNNLKYGIEPLIERKIPLIIYITTDFVDSNKMSWIDRIDYAVETTTNNSLSLNIGNFKLSDKKHKINTLVNIRKYAKNIHGLNYEAFSTEIQQQLIGVNIDSNNSILDQKLNWKQLKELFLIEGISIGGHTHTHQILSFAEEDKVKIEINHCLNLLNSKLNTKTNHFAYPDGEKKHYNRKVITELKKSDIICCPTAIEGVNSLEDNLFELKRVMVT